jgi:phage baseplate assembly protein gpV
MGDAIDHRWAVAGGIVAIQIRIIVAATTVVVVAVTTRIVAPARVAGVDEDGGGKRVVTVGGCISWTVDATDARGVVGFVGAGI